MAPRRAEIIAAAKELFAARGFDHTPIETIATRVGLLKGSLYHHIRSKDELLFEIVVGFYRACLANLRDATDGVRRPDEALTAAVRAHIEFVSAHAPERMIASHDGDRLREPHRTVVAAYQADLDALWVHLILEGNGLGLFDVAEPVSAAKALAAVVDTLADCRGRTRQHPVGQIVDDVAAVLTVALAGRPSTRCLRRPR